MLKHKFDGERWGWEQRVEIKEVKIMVPSGWAWNVREHGSKISEG